MSIEEAIFWGQTCLFYVALLAGPLLLAALVVGVTISLLQAMTQINEMTLVFIPKFASVFLVILLLGGFLLDQAVYFATTCFESAADWRR